METWNTLREKGLKFRSFGKNLKSKGIKFFFQKLQTKLTEKELEGFKFRSFSLYQTIILFASSIYLMIFFYTNWVVTDTIQVPTIPPEMTAFQD